MATKKTTEPKIKSEFPTYKGRPLVRCGDTIYYGSMKDKYVIKMEIKSKKEVGGEQIADKVTVQLMYTDSTIRTPRKQIVKSSEKNGLQKKKTNKKCCGIFQNPQHFSFYLPISLR